MFNIRKKIIFSFISSLMILSLLACSSEADKKEESIKDEWVIPTQYQNIPIEQIKSQIEITEYKTIKGAATTAGTESMSTTHGTSLVPGAKNAAVKDESDKSIKERKDLELYINKLVTLEGIINTRGTQKTSPLDIIEREPGKYEMWFCDKTRKPCRYQALLLYSGPEGKGDTLFKLDDRIRFWGVMLGEEIKTLRSTGNIKRYPKIVVIDLEIIS